MVPSIFLVIGPVLIRVKDYYPTSGSEHLSAKILLINDMVMRYKESQPYFLITYNNDQCIVIRAQVRPSSLLGGCVGASGSGKCRSEK